MRDWEMRDERRSSGVLEWWSDGWVDGWIKLGTSNKKHWTRNKKLTNGQRYSGMANGKTLNPKPETVTALVLHIIH